MKRTLMIAACVGLASIASAQKGSGTTLIVEPGSGVGATPNGTMSIIDSTYDEVLGATTTVFDISNTESWDLQGDTSNTVLGVPLPVGSSVTGIGWDVNLATVGASWLSEAVMSFDGLVNLTVGLGDDGPGTMAYSSGGIIDLSDNGIADILVPTGTLPIEFFEGYDDVADAVDANFTADSSLTIVYEGGAAGVPTVSQWGLIILTVMLLMGVVAMSLKSKEATA